MSKYIFILVLILFAACGDMEKEIPWETKNVPQKLVVDGGITTDLKYQYLKLKLSDDYFINKPPTMVNEATVKVSSSLRTYNFFESDTAPGTYYSEEPFAGVVGELYTMNVILKEPIEGVAEYGASSQMCKPMQIDTIYCNTYESPFATFDPNDSLLVVLQIVGLEPPGEDNYYLFKFYRNDTLMNDTLTRYDIYTDFENGLDGARDIYLGVYKVKYVPDDIIEVEIHSVPEHYYDFVYGCQLISTPPDPFGFMGPPANAVSNVNNGSALGYFYSSSIARGKTIVKKAEGFVMK